MFIELKKSISHTNINFDKILYFSIQSMFSIIHKLTHLVDDKEKDHQNLIFMYESWCKNECIHSRWMEEL